MESQLLNILNPDAQLRKEASDSVNRMCSESPVDSAQLMLKTILQQNQDQKLTEIACLILHKNILSKQDLFVQMPDLVLNEILTKLMEYVFSSHQQTLSFVRRSAEICMEITIKKNLHAQVLQMINNHIQQSQNMNQQSVKIFVLYCMELLCSFTTDQDLLMNTSMQILPYIQNQLNDNDREVQLQGAITITMLMSNIKKQEYLQNFQNVVQTLVKLIIEIVKEKDAQQSIKIIDNIDDLLTEQPKFMTPIVENLLVVFTDIIQCEEFDESVRIAAVNCIGTMCKNMPAVVKTSQVFNQKTLVVLYQTLMNFTTEELIDESMGHQNFTQKTISEKNLYGAIIMTLSTFTYSLTGKYCLKAMMPFCTEGLTSDDWKAQNTALVLIGVLSENTKKHFKDDLEQTMNMVLPYLNSSNSKVRYSCLTCLGLMCEEYTPEIQIKFGKQILDSLLNLMTNQDENLINLNFRAVSCLINFSRELLKKEIDEEQEDYSYIFQNHYDQIINSILSLLQYSVEKSNFDLLIEVLALVSILSNLMRENFTAHYKQFMTQLKNLLGKLQGGNLNDKQVDIKCYLIDTCGFLISANSKNFNDIQEDLNQLIQFLKQEIQNLDRESPILNSALQFYGMIARNLQENFLPLLNEVYELAMTCASQKVDIHLEDQENFEEKNKDYQSLKLDLKIYGGKKVLSINQAILTNKISGFNTLTILFKFFGQQFSPEQMQKTFELVQQQIEGLQSSTTKKQSMKILKQLIQNLPYEQALTAFNQVSTPLMSYIQKYFNTDNEEDLLDFLNKYNKILTTLTRSNMRGLQKQLQPPSNVTQHFDMINRIINQSKSQKEELNEEYDQMDLKDKDIKEEYDGNLEYIANLDLKAMEMSSELLKFDLDKNQQDFIINTLGSYFKQLMTQSQVVVESLATLSFFTDVIEFSPNFGRPLYLEMTYKFVMQELAQQTYQDLDYQQTLYYCLGCIMYHSPEGTAENVVKSSLSMLSSYMNNNQKNNDNAEIYDNVVSAIMKTYLVHNKSLAENCDQALTELYQILPLTSDLEESQTVNRFLVLAVNQQNPFLTGTDQRLNATKQYFQKLKAYVVKNPTVKLTDDFVNEFLKSVNQ